MPPFSFSELFLKVFHGLPVAARSTTYPVSDAQAANRPKLGRTDKASS
jgi:hypothetical protein